MTIKGLGNRLTQCSGLGKIMHHPHPGNALQECQRSPDRHKKRQSHHYNSKVPQDGMSEKHEVEINNRPFITVETSP